MGERERGRDRIGRRKKTLQGKSGVSEWKSAGVWAGVKQAGGQIAEIKGKYLCWVTHGSTVAPRPNTQRMNAAEEERQSARLRR